MSGILDTFLSADVTTQVIIVVALLWVGQKATQHSPRLRKAGQQVASAVFVGDVLWSVGRNGMELSDDPLTVLLHAGIVALFALLVSWAVLPVAASIADLGVASPARHFRRALARWQSGRQRRKERRAQQQSEAEWQRRQPERELAARQQQEEERNHQIESRRREQLRFDVRLFYDRYRSELQAVFPQDTFDSYFASFLTDSTPLDVFEQRAEQLKDMIRDRLQLGVQEQRRFENPEEVIQYFAEQQRRLTALVTDDPDVLDTLICDLAEARDKALKELFL